MALIGKIRQRSWILVGFIALALFIFIIEAALERNSLFGGGGGKTTLGKINGNSISATDYGSGVNKYEEGLKLINPDIQFTDQLRAQVQDEVWSTMAANEILGKTYKELGLDISQGEMADLMWGQVPHPLAQRFLMRVREVKPDIINQETGQIDQGKIREFITNIDQLDKQNKSNFRELLGHIERLIQDDQLKQKYASLVAQSFYMPTFMAKEVINSGRSARVSFVSVPYTSLPDEKYKVSDAEINAYIKEHKAQYEQKATRVVDAVAFDILPSADDTAQALSKIKELREGYLAAAPKDSAYIARNSMQGENITYYSVDEVRQTTRNADFLFSTAPGTLTDIYNEGSFYMFTKIIDRRVAPDTVRAAHVLLSLGSGSDDDKIKAKATADSLIMILQTGAKNFGQLAAENSLDEGSKPKGGDLGYFSRGQMVKAFNDQVFYSGMAPGQIAKVESPYGLHIILLIDAKAPKLVTKFADFAVELIPGNETEKLAYDNAVTFQQKNQTPEAFEKAAKTQAYFKNIVLTQNMYDVPQIGTARKLVQWAFQQEKTNVIEFFDANNKYVVARLNKIIEKGLPKAEDVREEVSAIIRNQKKGKDLTAQLDAAAAGNADLYAIAAKVKDAVVTDTALIRLSSGYVQPIGNEPKLAGTTFGIPVGKTSKAVAGERFAYIVQPKQVDENAPEMSGDINDYKKQMQRMFISRLNFQTIFESVLKKAKVEDKRYVFY